MKTTFLHIGLSEAEFYSLNTPGKKLNEKISMKFRPIIFHKIGLKLIYLETANRDRENYVYKYILFINKFLTTFFCIGM